MIRYQGSYTNENLLAVVINVLSDHYTTKVFQSIYFTNEKVHTYCAMSFRLKLFM